MLRLTRWAGRTLAVVTIAVLGMVAIAPAASAVETGWSWFPPGVYAKFSESETSGIVQAGAGGAAAYASAKLPSPPLKAAAAVLGVTLWLSARSALESADRKCVIIAAAVGLGARTYPTQC